MPYRYADARQLDKKPKIGDFECVSLVRHFTKAPPARMWREGEKVLGNKKVLPGTAIATFVNGRWPNLKKGNHAAFYIGQVSDGLYILEQWNTPAKKNISIRFISRKGRKPDGTYSNPSDNADAFSAIEQADGMRRRAKLTILIGGLLLTHSVFGGEQRIVCPTEVPEASIRIANTPSGWTPYVASPLFLSSAGATAGPPERRAILMGNSTWRKGKTEWSTTYDLDGTGFSEGKWIECRYGEYDQVSLSKRLDDSIRSCTVRISKGEKVGQQDVRITCKR